MTLEQLEVMNGEFLPIPPVAEYLGKKEQSVRESIRNGVPWGYVMGNADFRIPKRAFVNYHLYGGMIVSQRRKV